MPKLFIIDLLGTSVSEQEVAILQHPNVGALILFTRNFSNPSQLQDLIQTVRAIRPDIFIAIDHEGGIVQRFQRHGFRSLPAACVYGKVYDLNAEAGIALAEEYGEIMANDLIKYDIDISLAPVLDLDNEKSLVISQLDRAFHHDPDVVIQLTSAFIRGMNKASMPSVGKHFPGHGSVLADSHRSMPVYTESAETLRNKDLKPFVQLISQNLLHAVMPAHVVYEAIDSSQPAGFSRIFLQDILRTELNFQGVIISDCLGMAGADIGNMHIRANQALEAGCDMLIVCNQTRELLLEVLQTLTFEQTPESLERIIAFQRSMPHFTKSPKIASLISHTFLGKSKDDINPTDVANISSINTTTSI